MDGLGCGNTSCSEMESSEGKELKVTYNNLEELTVTAFKILGEATKSANKLPSGRNRDLYEICPSFHNILNSQGKNVLSIISNIMKHVSYKGNILRGDDDDKLEMIIDLNDSLLEKAGICLDEISGIKKNPDAVLFPRKSQGFFSGSWNNQGRVVDIEAAKILNSILNKTKNIDKPQLMFDDKVNNDPLVAFEPKLTYKYNMLKPLAISLQKDDYGISYYSHPYEFELLKFKPSEEQLQVRSPILFKPWEETTFCFVKTSEDVNSMIEDLKKYKEISVDLEYHSYRSFEGFTCLLQISTRDTDYVVDTLLLRSKLEVLNEIFTDPSVVKVFHGADLDILWLQKDLSLYVVNMFDTHQAAKLLNLPKLSLAYLLFLYCNIEAQKHFQLADWRIRPLPQELIDYARQDTHYLLYIYDKLKGALFEKGNGQSKLIELVVSESTRICLKRHAKQQFDENGYLDIYHRSKKLFDNRQKFALQRLYEWRDATARETDESLAYVLPNHMMLNISEVLPREAQGILACCNPVPPPVRQSLLVLHQIILKAREQPLIKPILEEQSLHRYTVALNSVNDPLHCPHDLNHEGEFRDDLPVLLKENLSSGLPVATNDVETRTEIGFSAFPIINIFENTSNDCLRERKEIVSVVHSTPYHKYKLAKKFSESVEAQKLITANVVNKEKDSCVQENKNIVAEENIKRAKRDDTNKEEVVVQEKLNEKTEDKKVLPMDNKLKRQNSKESDRPVKKVKSNNTSNDPFRISDLVAASLQPQKRRSGNEKKKQRREKKIIPFKYDAVDFGKFKTYSTENKKKNRKAFRNKARKKNFKISI